MANNRKHTGLICLIIVLGALLHNTGAVQIEEKLVGSDVVLKSQHFGVHYKITWSKENVKVVFMKLIPQEEPKFYPLLEDRATINRITGALTIKDLTIEDTGPYKAEVEVAGILYDTKIYLIVRVPRTEYKMEVEDVTLEPQYIGEPSEIKWTVNGNLLVEMSLKPREDPSFYRLQDRATIDPTDGSLTIRHLTIEDSGMYKAEVTVNDVIQETGIKVTVSELICQNEKIFVAGVFLAVLILIIIFLAVLRKKYMDPPRRETAFLIIYVVLSLILLIGAIFFIELLSCFYKKYWDPSKLEIAITVVMVVILIIGFIFMLWKCCNGLLQVTKEESQVTLKPEYIGDPSMISWKKNDKKLVDMKMTCLRNATFYSPDSRLAIHGINGTLAIRDLTVEDSGIYEAGVLVDKLHQYTKIRLAVQESCQCITVTFPEDPPKGNPCLTIHNMKPEDHGQYVLMVFQSNGKKKELDIKETDGIVNIRTEGDRVTLTWPDTGNVTKITWKKGGVTLFQWKVFSLTLHTNNITLEPGFVTVNDVEGSRPYKVEVHATENTSQLEANNQGNESLAYEELECGTLQMALIADNGPPERQPIDSIRFHPINVTNDNITWKKDDQLMIIDGNKIKSGLCGNLTINNVTPGDKGIYTVQCEGQDQEQEFILL